MTTTSGYFLNEMNKGNSYYDLLKVFDIHDTMYNEKFIEQYFKNMKLIYIMVKSYCMKQRKQTECIEPSGYKQVKNGRLMFFCTCAECGIKKTRFVKQNNLNSLAPQN